MILFFSGTGNSRYTAKLLAQITMDKILSINDIIKSHEKTITISSQSPLVFVVPTYGWRMPRIVDDFIRNTDFSGELSAYFILTCGDGTGNAVKYCKKICAEKGLKFMGMASIIMPENYIAMFSVPNQSEAKQIIKKAIPQILSIAEQIKAKKSLTLEKVSLAGKIASGLVNPLFYRLFIKDKGFYTTSKCTGCGKCVQLCTVNNISIINNRPQWNGNCIHCMACISGCPTLAIEYKNRSKGKPRYYLTSNPTI